MHQWIGRRLQPCGRKVGGQESLASEKTTSYLAPHVYQPGEELSNGDLPRRPYVVPGSGEIRIRGDFFGPAVSSNTVSVRITDPDTGNHVDLATCEALTNNEITCSTPVVPSPPTHGAFTSQSAARSSRRCATGAFASCDSVCPVAGALRLVPAHSVGSATTACRARGCARAWLGSPPIAPCRARRLEPCNGHGPR